MALYAMNQKKMARQMSRRLRYRGVHILRSREKSACSDCGALRSSEARVSLIERNMITAATRTDAPAMANPSGLLVVEILPTTKYTSRDPNPPMKLMTPLAGERSSGGTRSGIRAITGDREMPIQIFTKKSTRMNAVRDVVLAPSHNGIHGTRANRSPPMGSVEMMNGIRRPMRVQRWSDQKPTSGMSVMARILSRFITHPDAV